VGMGLIFVLALAVILFFALTGDDQAAGGGESGGAQETEEVVPDESATLHRPQAYDLVSGRISTSSSLGSWKSEGT
jgi:hypothetical protein